MKKEIPYPVSEDNFSHCWEYVDKHRRIARKQAAVARTGGFLVTLFFLLALVLFGAGLLSQELGGTFGKFWENFLCYELRQKTANFVLKAGDDLSSCIVKLVCFSYLISFLLFAALAVIIWLLYHPRKNKLPAGTYEENIALLAKKSQEARDYSYKTRISASVTSSVIAIAAIFVLFTAYVIDLNDAAAMNKLLTIFPTSDITSNCLLYVLFLYLVFGLVGSVLVFITRPVYRYDFPYDLVVQAQRASLVAQAQISDDSRLEKAAALRDEAIETERSGAYTSAKELFHKAAILGDVTAMEHYARHCLLNRMNDSARYWLKEATASGQVSPRAKKMLLRMNLRLRHSEEYLKPVAAPPTIGQKIKNGLLTAIKILWRLFILALFAAAVWIIYILFQSSTNPAALDHLPADLVELLTQTQSIVGTDFSQKPEIPVEEVSPFQTPVLELSIAGTKWEGNSIVNDSAGNPVVFCYSKDIGGDLHVPYYCNGETTVHSAGLFNGNKSDVRKFTKYVSCLPQTNTLVISEEYLMSREPGEYYIILDDYHYLPLIVSETTTFNSTQPGFAGQGNEFGWIINDLDDPQDITLYFYNLGDNPIRSLSQTQQLVMTPEPTITPMEEQYYTISPDGYSVTIHADYLAMQEVGYQVGFQVRLANGDTVDTGYTYIGTAQSGFTGLMEFQGEDTYSLSKGKDYTVFYTFGLSGGAMFMNVSVDGQSPFIEENLSDFLSDYVDLDNGIITLPEEILKKNLSKGDTFRIGISYNNHYGQMAFASFPVEVIK